MVLQLEINSVEQNIRKNKTRKKEKKEKNKKKRNRQDGDKITNQIKKINTHKMKQIANLCFMRK